MKDNRIKTNYVVGTILIIISISLTMVGVTLPLINKTINYLGWIGLALTCIGILIFIYGYFLLKKANFLKLNKHLTNNKDDENDSSKN